MINGERKTKKIVMLKMLNVVSIDNLHSDYPLLFPIKLNGASGVLGVLVLTLKQQENEHVKMLLKTKLNQIPANVSETMAQEQLSDSWMNWKTAHAEYLSEIMRHH